MANVDSCLATDVSEETIRKVFWGLPKLDWSFNHKGAGIMHVLVEAVSSAPCLYKKMTVYFKQTSFNMVENWALFLLPWALMFCLR